MKIRSIAVCFIIGVGLTQASQTLFEDPFQGALGEGWSWIREDRGDWRVTEQGLEIRVQPGNMWGGANNAKNVLVRQAPAPGETGLEVSVHVENRPTAQYEQIDLVWYYDDSHMVKIGQELVNGKLSVVMGREEKDRTRTIAIIPLKEFSVRLRLKVRGDQIWGDYQPGGSGDWKEAGKCSLPVPADGVSKISLQAYQGPANLEHWARLSQFQIHRLEPKGQ